MGSGCTASRPPDVVPTVEKTQPKPQTTEIVKVQSESPADVSLKKEEAQKEVTPPEPEKPIEPIQISDIWNAIENNDVTKVKRILTQADINTGELFNPKGQSILHVAAALGNQLIIGAILECNIPTMTPDILNSNLSSPLHIAIINDKLEVVKVLINFGADPNIEDEFGQTPLLLCSIHSRTEIAQFLCESNLAGRLSESLNVNAKDRK